MREIKQEKFISVDIEASGPIPGEYSMLSIGACVIGESYKSFYVKLKPLNNNFIQRAIEISGLSMKELYKSLENINIREAKKFSLGYKITALQQLILQRFQALTIISSISFVVAGIVLSTNNDLIQNKQQAILALFIFILVALISFGRHLYLIRDDIKAISQKIKELPDADWNQPFEEKEFKADWWPETLFGFLVIGVVIFGISFLPCL